jgi:hypothetical protein
MGVPPAGGALPRRFLDGLIQEESLAPRYNAIQLQRNARTPATSLALCTQNKDEV